MCHSLMRVNERSFAIILSVSFAVFLTAPYIIYFKKKNNKASKTLKSETGISIMKCIVTFQVFIYWQYFRSS